MNYRTFTNYPFSIYLIKFICTFSFLYFGTIAVIGLAAPGSYYSPLIDHYLNYVAWLRSSLLHGCKLILSVAGFDIYQKDIYTLTLLHGRGVHVGFDCLGYGVLSFWAAFIIANNGSLLKKVKWICAGLFFIWMINVGRIAILLIAINKQWAMPLGLDHHAWFNISAYCCIFIMIYFFDRSNKILKKDQLKF
jgi:exosortase/archaeosortase family protein